ncbi:hypothetical protein PM729_01380 [Enterococcus mundtii]|uniref:hypothetical protein n=1 Tax=Enterococcus mundtii TaxID=53346 RepID=UPI00232E288E|nr:hypothetical protein [Enterococcus mundtii]MDB7086340.1 hypothetical protein [Enterococcus mundtii]
MKYLIDSYNAYMVDGGLLDKGWQVVNWFFVGIPFFILRMCASFFLFCENIVNQSDFFIAKQTEVFNMSVRILNNFGGTGFGAGSLMGLAVIFSAYYLLANFFSNRRNFMKVLLHYLFVAFIFFGWFGQVPTAQGNFNTSTFLIKSVTEVTKVIQSQFIAGANTSSDSNQGGNGVYQSPMFDATVQQTFNFVNSGSLDGKMANGDKIDEKKLLESPNLSEEDRTNFIKERDEYISSLEKVNPYFSQDGVKTMEKSFAIWVGIANLFILAFPVIYINIMLMVIQILVILLILVFPIFALASFFPRCQTLMFKFFKALIGILFLPVIFGVFIAVLFWVNRLIDQAFLGIIGQINESLLNVLSNGMVLLGTMVLMILVKYIFLKNLWKNRYRIISFFSEGQIQQPAFEKQVNEKVKAGTENIVEKTTAAAQVGIGGYTGNMELALQGASTLMSGQDKAMNLGNEHFTEPNPRFSGLKQGMESFFQPENPEETEAPTYDDVKLEEEMGDSLEGELKNGSVSFQEMEEEAFDDFELEDVLTGIQDEDPTVDHSLTESDELVIDESQLGDDLIEQTTETESEVVEQDFEAPELVTEVPEIGEAATEVSVDNFDELQFAKEEQAFFDQKHDPELLVNDPVNQVNQVSFNQQWEHTGWTESEEQFFSFDEEKQSTQHEVEDW